MKFSIFSTALLKLPKNNPVERLHRTIIAMLRTRGDGIQDNWDLRINASVFSITLQLVVALE